MLRNRQNLAATASISALVFLAGCQNDSEDHFLGEWTSSTIQETDNVHREITVDIEITAHERGVKVEEQQRIVATVKPGVRGYSGSDISEEEHYFLEVMSDTELGNEQGGGHVRFTYDPQKETLTEPSSMLRTRGETVYERR